MDCKAKVPESDDVKKMFDDHVLMMNQVAGALESGNGKSHAAMQVEPGRNRTFGEVICCVC
jgi:hypothetical protein